MNKILVHCCCGPCATSSVRRLLDEGYDVVLYYANSNICSLEENNLRFDNLKKVASYLNVTLIRGEYDHKAWLSFIAGLEAEPEGGKRCLKCFEFNLRDACAVAASMKIDYFTTTLTVSRFKNSASVFAVGSAFPGFESIDFKKKDGFAKSVRMSKELGLYRQQFCGCEFSK